MQIELRRIARHLILALALGAVLVPLAPDTGSVVAETQFTHRIDLAHQIVELAH